jgi:TRAP-type C4-dicarboxylate transport system substrate-binding protein
MAGLTIWCEADWNGFVEECGATPVNTPFSEVYSSLQKNMYDGMLIPTETLQSCNFAEVCKYCVKLNLCYASAPGHLMNMDTWNSLPDDIKEIIDSEEIRSVVEKANVEGFKAAEEGAMEWAEETYGTKEIVLTDEEHTAFMELVQKANLEKAAELDSKGLPGTEIVEALAKWTEEWK